MATIYKATAFAFCSLRLLARLVLVRSYDMVVIHREAFPLGRGFVERLVAKLNANTVFDFDDALWAPMPLAVDQLRGLRNAERTAATMLVCRAVVAGNEYLAAYARRYCRDVEIIPTPYPDLGGGAAVIAAPEIAPIIVWIGNVGNEEYLRMLAGPLARLARRFDFVFRVIGSIDVVGMQLDGVRVEALEWREDRERQWLLESAIGVMPLEDREYERGKCSFKLVQYFSAGMPAVASPVGMNTEAVRHGENGFLATTEEEWYVSLALLLEDAERRRQMGQRAYALYRERFTPEVNAERWVRLFRRLAVAPTAAEREE